jgi:cysteine desulfuration protein SufE
MDSIQQKLDRVRSDFSAMTDGDAKWEYLLKLARLHPAMDLDLRQDQFLVKGCATRLYLVPKFENGLLNFVVDTDGGSESPLIVRGLAALVSQIYSGSKPQEILSVPPEFFQEIGLNVALSATRANGFASLLKQLYMYAQVYQRMAALGA